jgi:hypothetical protein
MVACIGHFLLLHEIGSQILIGGIFEASYFIYFYVYLSGKNLRFSDQTFYRCNISGQYIRCFVPQPHH